MDKYAVGDIVKLKKPDNGGIAGQISFGEDDFYKKYEQKDRLYVIKGNVPSLYDMPAGCGFWPRCPYATERCKTEVPDLYQIGDRKVRCFLHENRKQVV